MEIKLSGATETALRKAASSQRKTAEQFVEELLARRYQTGVTVTDYAMIFDGGPGRFDSGIESKVDMVITIRMSDQAGVNITNAARKAGTTAEALILRLVEEKYGRQDSNDPHLRTRVALDLLKSQEASARDSYVERLKTGSRR